MFDPSSPMTSRLRSRLLVALSFVAALLAAGSPPALAAPSYPLRVDPGGRLLLDAQDRPVFLQGDAPWHIIARLDRPTAQSYLQTRREQGFNALLVSILVDDDFGTGSFANVFGDQPFTTPGDFSTPNEAYFAQVDWFLQEADAQGFVVLLFPAYIGFDCVKEGFCQTMIANGPAVMRDYGRFLGARYRDQRNIIWVDGGDADAAAHGALDVVNAVAEGILENDPVHLHTAHCNRFNSAADCYDQPWLDLNSTYADCTRTPVEVQRDYQRTPVRPFFYIEGRYEFESDWTDTCIRAQAYWSLLGGAMGHFYGSGRTWDFPSDWTSGMQTPGTTSMQHFFELLRSRRWDLLVPDTGHTTLTAGFGDIDTGGYASAARTIDGNTVLVYTPDRRPLSVAMNRVAGAEARAWWFDPRTGTSTAIGTFATTGSLDFEPAADGDWVLVLDNADTGFDPPGQTDIFVAVETPNMGGVKGAY